MNNNILSLLGLALRGGRLAVGEEPVALAAKSGQARLLLAASDAAGNTLRRAEHLAEEGHCLWLILPFTKAELGGALGRGTAAIAALTDTGLAAALTKRLAILDPERYQEAAGRMELKLRRAKERKTNPRPPRKVPPPRRENRPDARREGGPETRPPKDGQRREDRRFRSGEDRGGKPGRPPFNSGKPSGRRKPPQSGKPGRPYGGRPQGGRPGGGRPGGGRGPNGGRGPAGRR